MIKKFKYIIFLILVFLVTFISGCGKNENQSEIKSLDDLSGKKVAIIVGTIHDKLISERVPDAQIEYYNNLADGIAALKSGSVDAYVQPGSSALFLMFENPGLKTLDEHLLDGNIAFIFPKTDKGKALNAEFSEFVVSMRQQGELDKLREKWFAEGEAGKNMPKIPKNGKNGVLKLATSATQVPYTYIRDNENVGLEIELAVLFANQYDYGLDIIDMNFDGLIPYIKTDLADMACSCFAITEERKESVDFAESHIQDSVVVMVMDSDYSQKSNIFSSIIEKIDKTFIREKRYKMFIDGVVVTLSINLLSIFFGTLIGFFVFFLCRKSGKKTNKIIQICIWLIQGTPVVVLLMILYYIVFAKLGTNPFIVSVIGFTLIFSCAVFNMLSMGFNAVDIGQTEAAYALGYSDSKTVFRILLPQAAQHFIPAFKTQVTALLKATSVVGFIAVTDLTRAGDLVRSRTYEPFFSLISVAIIYFMLEALCNLILNNIEKKINPENRSDKKVLKGVKTDD